jgi:hypothetical protein
VQAIRSIESQSSSPCCGASKAWFQRSTRNTGAFPVPPLPPAATPTPPVLPVPPANCKLRSDCPKTGRRRKSCGLSKACRGSLSHLIEVIFLPLRLSVAAMDSTVRGSRTPACAVGVRSGRCAFRVCRKTGLATTSWRSGVFDHDALAHGLASLRQQIMSYWFVSPSA